MYRYLEVISDSLPDFIAYWFHFTKSVVRILYKLDHLLSLFNGRKLSRELLPIPLHSLAILTLFIYVAYLGFLLETPCFHSCFIAQSWCEIFQVSGFQSETHRINLAVMIKWKKKKHLRISLLFFPIRTTIVTTSRKSDEYVFKFYKTIFCRFSIPKSTKKTGPKCPYTMKP